MTNIKNKKVKKNNNACIQKIYHHFSIFKRQTMYRCFLEYAGELRINILRRKKVQRGPSTTWPPYGGQNIAYKNTSVKKHMLDKLDPQLEKNPTLW